MHNEIKKDIIELNELWQKYISIPKSSAESIELLKDYHEKLNMISKKYDIDLEVISKISNNT